MASTPAHAPDRILPGILLMLGFCLIAPWIDVAAKLAAIWASTGMIMLARFAVQGTIMGAAMSPMGLTARLPRQLWAMVALRAATALLSTFTFVAAIAVMPLADAMAIAYVQPFVVLLLGWALMGEAVGPRRLAASAVGFAGALLVIRPNFAAFGAVALLPLAAAGSFAVYVLVTRHLRGLHPVAMQFHTSWVAVAMALPFLLVAGNLAGWPPARIEAQLPWQAWACLLAVGVAGSISHLSMTYALRFAPSATLAPLGYLEIPVVAVLGYLVFADLPDPMAQAGIVVIVAAGLYVIHRERVVARTAGRPVSPPPSAP